MTNRARIRVAAALTTLFVAGLAGFGLASRDQAPANGRPPSPSSVTGVVAPASSTAVVGASVSKPASPAASSSGAETPTYEDGYDDEFDEQEADADANQLEGEEAHELDEPGEG